MIEFRDYAARWILPLWLIVLWGAGSGCAKREVALEVQHVSPAEGTLHRNEEVRIRFTEPLQTPCPASALVTLHDAKDHEIDALVSVTHDTVILSPPDGRVWPETKSFRLEVKRGVGAPLRSRNGLAFKADATYRFKASSEWVDDGRPFELHSIADGVLHDVRRNHIFTLHFSHAVDPRSLSGARPTILVHCRPPSGRSYTIRPEVTLTEGGRVAYVRPWRVDSPFAPSTEHRLIVQRRVLSRTGRRLERQSIVSFVTSSRDTFEGRMTFDFDSESLDRKSNPDFDFTLPYARAIAGPIEQQGIFDDGRHEPVGSVVPFSSEPSRLQLLLPGRRLGSEPGLITGFSWKRARQAKTTEDVGKTVFPRLLLRMGHAKRNSLTTRFDDNFSLRLGPIHETVAEDSLNGEWTWHPARTPEISRWVNIGFAHPFIYTGDSRDLVLEIINEEGSRLDAGAIDQLDWATGRLSSEKTARALAGLPGMVAGQHVDRVFSTRIHMKRYQEVISRWQIAEIGNPVYSLLRTGQPNDHILAEGQENVDFRFLFQGATVDSKGNELTRTRWEPLVTRLNGCQKLRVKIVFLPDTSRRANTRTEVRQLSVRYTESLKDR